MSGLEQDVAAEHRQPGLLLRGDDVECDAGFLAHPLDEVGAVFGAAAGLGRDRAGEEDVAALELVGADLERAHRPVHRRIAQPPARRQPFAQAHHAAEGVDHDERVALGPRDQQAAVVGTEIDRGIGLAPLRRGAAAVVAMRGTASRRGAVLDRAGFGL